MRDLLPTKSALEAIARHLDVAIRREDRLDDLVRRIVEATIGFRLSSAAIQARVLGEVVMSRVIRFRPRARSGRASFPLAAGLSPCCVRRCGKSPRAAAFRPPWCLPRSASPRSSPSASRNPRTDRSGRQPRTRSRASRRTLSSATRETTRPLLVVELDDQSHARPERKSRDALHRPGLCLGGAARSPCPPRRPMTASLRGRSPRSCPGGTRWMGCCWLERQGKRHPHSGRSLPRGERGGRPSPL